MHKNIHVHLYKITIEYTRTLLYNTVRNKENNKHRKEVKNMLNIEKLDSLGLMATQYERYGAITKEEVIEAYIDEELEITIENLGDYNEYLEEQGESSFYESWEELVVDHTPEEAVRMTYFGNFRFSDDYFSINAYENIDSYTEHQVLKMMQDDRDFAKWIIAKYGLLDDPEIKIVCDYGNQYLAKGY